MSIFGNVFTKKNKKDNDNCCDLHTIEETACTCRDTHWPTSHADNSSIVIKIMGTGCKNATNYTKTLLKRQSTQIKPSKLNT